MEESAELFEDALVRRGVANRRVDAELLLDGVDGVSGVQVLQFSLEHVESGHSEEGVVDEVVVVRILVAKDKEDDVVVLALFLLLLLRQCNRGAKLNEFVQPIEG